MITKIPGLIYEVFKIGVSVVSITVRKQFTSGPTCNKEFTGPWGNEYIWFCNLPTGHEGECEIPKCENYVPHRFCEGDRYWQCSYPMNHPGDCI